MRVARVLAAGHHGAQARCAFGQWEERLWVTSAISFDADHDRCTCPAGKGLHVTGQPLTEDGKVLCRR